MPSAISFEVDKFSLTKLPQLEYALSDVIAGEEKTTDSWWQTTHILHVVLWYLFYCCKKFFQNNKYILKKIKVSNISEYNTP